jgi:DNA-directed RNA polymerase subunit omega
MRTELVEKASEVITDIPTLINMVSKRVRQLNNGRSPLIPMIERLGAADIALTEIIEGKIIVAVAEPSEA